MRVIIMGCGRLGAELATKLSLEKHSVAIVDRDLKAFHRLRKGFLGETIHGVGYHKDVMLKAGIERADAFVAVTNGDNHNIVGALTAKQRFRVPKVVARIYDPQRALIYRRLGVPTVATTTWASHKIRELLLFPDFHADSGYGNGEVEMTRVKAPLRLVGQAIESLNIPGQLQVVAITRLGQAFIPMPGATFEEGDVVRIVAAKPALGQLHRFLHG